MSKGTNKLKIQLVNILLRNGCKDTSECSVAKFLKIVQKKAKKNHKVLIKAAVSRLTPVFQTNKTKIKKGRRKIIKVTPAFVLTNSHRSTLALKLLGQSSRALNERLKKGISASLAEELLTIYSQESKSLITLKESHIEAIVNKRYLAKFYW